MKHYYPPEGKTMDIFCGMCGGWMRIDEDGGWYCPFTHHPAQSYQPQPAAGKRARAIALDQSVEGFNEKLTRIIQDNREVA